MKIIETIKGELFNLALLCLLNINMKFEAGERRAYSTGTLRGALEGFPGIIEPKGPQN